MATCLKKGSKIRENGGSIWLDSAGRGAKFSLAFPEFPKAAIGER